MIQLNQNPMENSAVTLNLNFRDNFGTYYIPNSVTYTLLALNNDKETWSVVDGLYKKKIEPQSSINLTIPKMKLISGTTVQRKIVIEWNAKIQNEFVDLNDEVEFCIQPRPNIINKPDEPPPYQVEIKLTDINLQVGSPSSAPIKPIVMFETNLPCDIDDATFVMSDGENSIDCVCTHDDTFTKFRVSTEDYLQRDTDYTLTINGLVAKNGIIQTKVFTFGFKTTDERSYLDINADLIRHDAKFEELDLTIENIESDIDDINDSIDLINNNLDDKFDVENVTTSIATPSDTTVPTSKLMVDTINSLEETEIIDFDSWN